jgi:ferredoxin-like protein FixX
MSIIAAAPTGTFDEVDRQTSELILQLQSDDLDEIQNRAAGKQKEGSFTDGDVAIDLMKEILKTAKQNFADKRMAESIMNAVHLDSDTLRLHKQEEDVALQDHAYARRVDGGGHHPKINPDVDVIDDGVLSRLVGLYVSEDVGLQMLQKDSDLTSGAIKSRPESSVSAAQKGIEAVKQCSACFEVKPFFNLMPTPCEHEYCRDCLQDLFRSSFADESLFPPRCCRQDIHPSRMSIFLNPEIEHQFEKKKVEFSTVNKTYCCQSSCSSFIPPDTVNMDVGTCPECGTMTCIICKMAAHDGTECPNDMAMQAVEELARQNGWQSRSWHVRMGGSGVTPVVGWSNSRWVVITWRKLSRLPG